MNAGTGGTDENEIVCDVRVTVTCCVTCTAAAYAALPAWSAAIVHVPAATNVIVPAEMLHVSGVSTENVTALPDAPPVAPGLYVAPTSAGLGALEVNAIVCVTSVTVTLCVCCDAAAYALFPA